MQSNKSGEDWYCSVKVHSIVLPNEITTPHMHVCMYLNFIEHTLKRGESIFHQKGNLVANIWQDKKVMLVMSTNCDPTGLTKVCRKQKDGTTEIVTSPPPPMLLTLYRKGKERKGNFLTGPVGMQNTTAKQKTCTAKIRHNIVSALHALSMR